MKEDPMHIKTFFLLCVFLNIVSMSAMESRTKKDDNIVLMQYNEAQQCAEGALILTSLCAGWTAGFVLCYLKHLTFRNLCVSRSRGANADLELSPIYKKMSQARVGERVALGLALAGAAGVAFWQSVWHSEGYEDVNDFWKTVKNNPGKALVPACVGFIPGCAYTLGLSHECDDIAVGGAPCMKRLESYVKKYQGEEGIPSFFNGHDYAPHNRWDDYPDSSDYSGYPAMMMPFAMVLGIALYPLKVLVDI